MTSQSSLLRLSLKLALGAASLVAVATVAPRVSLARVTERPITAIEQSGNYDLTPTVVGDCKVGSECTVTLTATTKGEFHVNDSYPFKLTLAAAGVEFHGSQGATFVGSDFARQGKTVGVMTIKFKPSAKGAITLTGKYKVCFCTDKECAPSTIDVSIPVNVK